MRSLRQALPLGRSPQTTDVDAQDTELSTVEIGDFDLEWPYDRQKKRGDSTPLVFPNELSLPGCPCLVLYETDVGSLTPSIGGFMLGAVLLKTN